MPAALKVYLLARPSFDEAVFLSFLGQENLAWRQTGGATHAEEIVEAAGRICYMSFGAKQSPRSNLEYIKNLIQMGHESVLEHISWTVLITGISRAFTHQLVRHRVGFAFSQLSQQYHDERNADFVMPVGLEDLPDAAKAWNQAVEAAQQAYAAIIESLERQENAATLGLGKKKEVQRAVRSAARSVLPNATETKIIMTANARAIRHLFKTRGAIPGDIEMRSVTAELLRILRPEAPAVFFDFEVQIWPDKLPAVVYVPEERQSQIS